jgi:hypothetical protein
MTAERVPPSSSSKPSTVGAATLAAHLDCARAYVRKLEAEGVLHRAPDGSGYPLDANRIAYLRYLRRERQHSPRSAADAEHTVAKAELLRIRIAEKQRELMPVADHNALVDAMAGTVLTAMAGMAARIGGHDLQLRRRIDQVVYETRVAIAHAANRMADERGEPPEEQANG